MKLNPEQQQAVYSNDSKIVCLAGAGAGKTAVLVSRICRLIDDGVDPSSMLILTFTKAAAMEMRERFYRSRDKRLASPDFRTFHSFCFHVMCHNAGVRKALGYTSVPVIADDNQEKRIKTETRLQINSSITDNKMKGKEPLTPKEKYELQLYKKALLRKMKAENLITFDTLSDEITGLFIKDDPSIKCYKDKIKYIFADENQDTNPIESKFMLSFSDAKLFVVGDLLQNLYSFRGSDSRIMKRYVDDPTWTTIKLYRNYRSKSAICDYANKITQCYARPQYRIELITDTSGGCVKEFQDEYRCDAGEVCDETLHWLVSNVPNMVGTTAILARSNSEVGMVRDYLKDHNVQFVSKKRDEEPKHILSSVADNTYFLDWLSMFLNKSQYHQYLRLKAIQNPEKPVQDFKDKFYHIPHIQYRFDTVVRIRNILKSDELPFVQCQEIFKLLGMNGVKVDTDAKTPREIMDYVADTLEQVVSSDVYVGTIHSVKGLEYDNVVLVGVNNTSFQLRDDEDMWNLFYVGATRAKENLYVFKYTS